jgi:pSer/pThr/pTyr-binding forkhead associated (FHA) protein
VAGPDHGKELLLSELGRAYVIGRGPGLDLTLVDVDCSRRHVEVSRRGPSIWIKDLGSKNGAELDGVALKPHKETPWPRGKLVKLGATELGYDDPVSEALVEIEASSDEKMRDADSVEPPTALPASASSVPPSEAGAAPIARVPRAEAAPARRKGGFRTADLVIAVLAIVVLVASLAGIFWLSRMK